VFRYSMQQSRFLSAPSRVWPFRENAGAALCDSSCWNSLLDWDADVSTSEHIPSVSPLSETPCNLSYRKASIESQVSSPITQMPITLPRSSLWRSRPSRPSSVYVRASSTSIGDNACETSRLRIQHVIMLKCTTSYCARGRAEFMLGGCWVNRPEFQGALLIQNPCHVIKIFSVWSSMGCF